MGTVIIQAHLNLFGAIHQEPSDVGHSQFMDMLLQFLARHGTEHIIGVVVGAQQFEETVGINHLTIV